MHLKKVTFMSDKYPTDKYYPFNQEMFRKTREIEFDAPVTFIVGDNGCGKSTFLHALCRKCGITIWRGRDYTRMVNNPYEEELHRYMRVEYADGHVPGSFFGSDLFRSFAETLDEWAAADPGQLEFFGGKSLITLSHGQSLMSFFEGRYKVRGLYILDEPETALSPKTQIELVRLLHGMGQAGHAQFIVASHSPILLACPGARIISFDQVPPREAEYEETDHFRVYRDFLNDRASFL